MGLGRQGKSGSKVASRGTSGDKIADNHQVQLEQRPLRHVSTSSCLYAGSERYWVERPFQDAKNQCGMGDYQARGWLAWHHHMSMVILAMLFLLEQRLNNHEKFRF